MGEIELTLVGQAQVEALGYELVIKETEHTKQLARSMLGLVTSLQNSLQERID